jgi:homocitrate synthase
MTDAQYKECTAKVKEIADIRPLAIDDSDSILRTFHLNVKMGSDRPLLGTCRRVKTWSE